MFYKTMSKAAGQLARWRITFAVLGLTLVTACGSGGGNNAAPAGVPGSTLPAPDIVASMSVGIAQPLSGQEVRMTPSVSVGTSTASPTVEIIGVSWNFGDGSRGVDIVKGDGYGLTTPQDKSYAQPGDYVITLTATDSAGRSAVVTRTVSVQSFLPTGKLNDTGIDWCSENITTPGTWVNKAICSAVSWAGHLWGTEQDAYHGRDAVAAAGALAKQGSGVAGFDFTRLGANGQALAIQNGTYSPTGNEAEGTRWDCIKDNHTGLIWEIKRMDDLTHPRYYAHRYGWYNPDNTRHGGSAGHEGTPDEPWASGPVDNACTGVPDLTKCNTQVYQQVVNAQPKGQALCGFRDWRLPSVDELSTLTHLGTSNIALDTAHFPDFNSGRTPWGGVWTASPHAEFPQSAWLVNFVNGEVSYSLKRYGYPVRLVRSGRDR